MATYSLSGTGVQALSAGVTAVHVTITTTPTNSRLGTANPANLYDVCLLRWGDATGYFDAVPVVGGPQWLAVPAGATKVAYACKGGAVISLAEVIGGVPPFGGAGALSSLSDVALASVADTQVLTYSASASKWVNAAPSGGGGGSGMSHIATVTLTGSQANITMSSIPATFRHLWLEAALQADIAGSTMSVVNVWLNGDTTLSHYKSDQVTSNNRYGICGQASAYLIPSRSILYNYASSTAVQKVLSAMSGRTDGSSDQDVVLWNPTSAQAVTQIQLLPASGNFIVPSVATLYGLP